METTNHKLFKIIIGILVTLIVLIGIWYFFVKNKGISIPKQSTIVNSLQKEALDKKLAEITPETLYKLGGDNKEFFDSQFSLEYKQAYTDYIKGILIFNQALEKEYKEEYLKKALNEFAAIINSTEKSNKERAYAINIVNLIYIATNWNDALMRDTVFQSGLAKQIFDDIQNAVGKDYPALATTKDLYSAYDQNALLGASSQATMSRLNLLSYELYPNSYSLMRRYMNRTAANKRLWDVDSGYKGLTGLEKFRKYYRDDGGKTALLAYQTQIDKLEKEGKLFLDLGQFAPEIYIMKTQTLWDPLIAVSEKKEDKVLYQKKLKDDFKKAVDMVDASVNNDKPMIKMFYIATLVDYGITKKVNSVISPSEQATYQEEAKSIMHALIAKNSPVFESKVKLGASLSVKPVSVPAEEEYYGGAPFYQLRVLGENDPVTKEYLIKNGWKF